MQSPGAKILTIEQLRARIDAGLTRDKVSASDPAAAPLGADDEAAGTPPTAEQVQLEARSVPLAGPRRHVRLGFPIYVGVVVAISVVVFMIVWFGRS